MKIVVKNNGPTTSFNTSVTFSGLDGVTIGTVNTSKGVFENAKWNIGVLKSKGEEQIDIDLTSEEERVVTAFVYGDGLDQNEDNNTIEILVGGEPFNPCGFNENPVIIPSHGLPEGEEPTPLQFGIISDPQYVEIPQPPVAMSDGITPLQVGDSRQLIIAGIYTQKFIDSFPEAPELGKFIKKPEMIEGIMLDTFYDSWQGKTIISTNIFFNPDILDVSWIGQNEYLDVEIEILVDGEVVAQGYNETEYVDELGFIVASGGLETNKPEEFFETPRTYCINAIFQVSVPVHL